MKSIKIKTIKQLDKVLGGADDNYEDFAISLNGGCFSRKEIRKIDDTYYINNCIDDSEDELTEKELFDEKITNIGKAMKLGSFYHLKY